MVLAAMLLVFLAMIIHLLASLLWDILLPRAFVGLLLWPFCVAFFPGYFLLYFFVRVKGRFLVVCFIRYFKTLVFPFFWCHVFFSFLATHKVPPPFSFWLSYCC